MSRSQNSEHIKWILNESLRHTVVLATRIKTKENKNRKPEGYMKLQNSYMKKSQLLQKYDARFPL